MNVTRLIILVLLLGNFMPADANAIDTIFVEFFEDEADTPFAVSDVPVNQLPDTFEVRTTMQLEGEDWIVLAAEPPQKAQFHASGTLKLYLAKADTRQIDPNDLLYSLPTICNSLPAIENADSLEDVVVFTEDDWRQFEFVDARHAALIEEELSSISRIYEEYRDGMGFRDIHVRKKIESPLAIAALTLDTLTDHFNISREHAGVAFDTAAAKVVGGFALSTESGWVLWGQVDDDGMLLTLNLHPTDEALMDGFSEKADAFMEVHGLYVVDWVRLFWSDQGRRPFADYAN